MSPECKTAMIRELEGQLKWIETEEKDLENARAKIEGKREALQHVLVRVRNGMVKE